MFSLLILLAIVPGRVLAAVLQDAGMYNGLITARDASRNALAQIDVQLHRRSHHAAPGRSRQGLDLTWARDVWSGGNGVFGGVGSVAKVRPAAPGHVSKIEAIKAAIRHDGRAGVADSGLLRTSFGVLHCPLPAMLERA